MSYLVKADMTADYSFSPENTTKEVVQNVRMILSTVKGSVPLLRNFGIPRCLIDKPIPVAESLAVGEIVDAIETYEPRASVDDISFERDDQHGILIPIVEVSVDGR